MNQLERLMQKLDSLSPAGKYKFWLVANFFLVVVGLIVYSYNKNSILVGFFGLLLLIFLPLLGYSSHLLYKNRAEEKISWWWVVPGALYFLLMLIAGGIGLLVVLGFAIGWYKSRKPTTPAPIKNVLPEKLVPLVPKEFEQKPIAPKKTQNQLPPPVEILAGPEHDLVTELGTCPFCKKAGLNIIEHQSLFGLLRSRNIQCSNCLSLFTSKGENQFVISTDLRDSNQRFNGSVLTTQDLEWIRDTGKTVRENTLSNIEKGNLPILTDTDSLQLQKGEVLHFSEPVAFFEPRSIRNYGGGSFRVAKGVRIHMGQSESHLEWRKIDGGDLYLTNKRLVYVGSLRTVSTDLPKVVSATAEKDGLQISRANKQKPEFYSVSDPEKWELAINKLLRI